MTKSKYIFLTTLLFSSLSFAQTSSIYSLKITPGLVTWGFRPGAANRQVKAIIVHSSYNALSPDSFSCKGVIQEYRDAKVAPHYIIDRSGAVTQLVKENNVAYHAGKSRLPDGTANVNEASIGIEIINTKMTPPTARQYEALNKLIRDIKSRYQVKYVLGHSDIAPGRKDDPWKFDWNKVRKESK